MAQNIEDYRHEQKFQKELYSALYNGKFIDDREQWQVNSDTVNRCPLSAMVTDAVDAAGFGFSEDSNRHSRLDRATIGEEGYFVNGKIMVPHEPAPRYTPPAHHRIEYIAHALKCRLETAADIVEGFKALEIRRQDALSMLQPYRREGEKKARAFASMLLVTAQELDAVTVNDSCAKQAQAADIYDCQSSSLNRPPLDDEEAHFDSDSDTEEESEPTPKTVEYHMLYDGNEPGLENEDIDRIMKKRSISALRKFRKELYEGCSEIEALQRWTYTNANGKTKSGAPDPAALTQAYRLSKDRIGAVMRKTAKTAGPDLLYWLEHIRNAAPQKIKVVQAFVATIANGKTFDWRGKKISMTLNESEKALLWEAFNVHKRNQERKAKRA